MKQFAILYLTPQPTGGYLVVECTNVYPGEVIGYIRYVSPAYSQQQLDTIGSFSFVPGSKYNDRIVDADSFEDLILNHIEEFL